MLSLFPSALSASAQRRVLWLERWTPYLIVLLAVLGLLVFPTKSWETNDDIAMAMISQGYGIAAHPSAGVIFSNVIWGWVLMHVPSIAGISSYGLATYALLLTAGSVLCASLVRMDAPSFLVASLLLVMFVTVLLHPQFTILAGYLAVAGIVVNIAWKESPSNLPLCVAWGLLSLAGLIRMMEMLFVVGVMLPVLAPLSLEMMKTRALKRRLGLAIAVGATLCAAHVVDTRYYSSPEWQEFRTINQIRVPFTDYHFAAYLKNNPEALRRASISGTDVRMFSDWFFQDPSVLSAPKMKALTQSVPWTARLDLGQKNYRSLLVNFSHRPFTIMFFTFPILLLIGFRRDTVSLVSFTLLLGCMFLLYLIGRAGETRVYIAPLAGVLCIFLAQLAPEARSRMRIVGVLGLGVLLPFVILRMIGQKPNPVRPEFERIVCDVAKDHLPIVWGATGFPTQMFYRPGAHYKPACDLPLYSIGSMQLAPYALENLHRYTQKSSIVEALMAGEHLSIFTTQSRINLLNAYFAEHYSTALQIQHVLDRPHLQLFIVSMGGRLKDKPVVKPADEDDDDPLDPD